jgi:hypothetical protein
MRTRRYKRWVGIGDNPFRRSLRQARRLGMAIIDGGKPGFCAWHSFCFEATAGQMRRLESWWDARGIEWFRRRPAGAWPVSDEGPPVPWPVALANAG